MSEPKKILHLTLKRKFFEMIASGEKKEEYRSINDYWSRRFMGPEYYKYEREIMHNVLNQSYDVVHFRNGYHTFSPTMEIEFKGLSVGIGKPEWGATEESFIIKLGKILSIKNYNQDTPSLNVSGEEDKTKQEA